MSVSLKQTLLRGEYRVPSRAVIGILNIVVFLKLLVVSYPIKSIMWLIIFR